VHSRHEGIVITWKIDLNEAHYVEVFVWDSVEHLRAANQQEDINGYCNGNWISKRVKGKLITLAGKKFGEIHLVRSLIGVGMVAHELMHLVNYWTDFCHWTYWENDEDIAQVMEAVTRDFWNRFYEAFPAEVNHA